MLISKHVGFFMTKWQNNLALQRQSPLCSAKHPIWTENNLFWSRDFIDKWDLYSLRPPLSSNNDPPLCLFVLGSSSRGTPLVKGTHNLSAHQIAGFEKPVDVVDLDDDTSSIWDAAAHKRVRAR